jgi:hypothetical protein
MDFFARRGNLSRPHRVLEYTDVSVAAPTEGAPIASILPAAQPPLRKAADIGLAVC